MCLLVFVHLYVIKLNRHFNALAGVCSKGKAPDCSGKRSRRGDIQIFTFLCYSMLILCVDVSIRNLTVGRDSKGRGKEEKGLRYLWTHCSLRMTELASSEYITSWLNSEMTRWRPLIK